MSDDVRNDEGSIISAKARMRGLLRSRTNTDSSSKPLGTAPGPQKRLTVVEKYYYQSQGEPIRSLAGSKYVKALDAQGEDAYERTYKIGENLLKLDTGWIEGEIAMLRIINTEGTNWRRIPTKEQMEEISEKNVLVKFVASEHHHWIIPPGESMKGIPSDIDELHVCCTKGEARITVCIVPK